MTSRFARATLTAASQSIIRGAISRPVVPRATLPGFSTTSRRRISIPSFSDLLRGRFSQKNDAAQAVQGDTPAQEQIEGASLFDAAEEQANKQGKKYAQHKYSTAVFKISRRKLNLLANQIAGKPIDVAILQMQFSDKRAAQRIKSTLCLARDHAQLYKNLTRDKLVVAEAWVTKGKYLKRVDVKGRGRLGRKHHPSARMSIVLKEGKTHAETVAAERKYKLRRIVGPGLVREDIPIRNPSAGWAW